MCSGLVPYLHALRASSGEKGLQVVGPVVGARSMPADHSKSSKSNLHENGQSHRGHQRCQVFAKLNGDRHSSAQCYRRERHHHFHIHLHHHHYLHDRSRFTRPSPERFTDASDHHLIAVWLPSLSVPNRLSEQRESSCRLNNYSHCRPSSEGCLKKSNTTDTTI